MPNHCKVLLIQPPYSVAPDVARTVAPPLGLAYIAAVLRNNGFDVSILDSIAEGYDHTEKDGNFIRYGLGFGDIARRIELLRPNVVGVSSMFTIQHPNVRHILEIVKRLLPDTITVIGGAHPTARVFQVMEDPNLDFAVLGEGEMTMLSLAQEKRLDDIDGIAFRRNGKTAVNKKTSYIEDLDKLPMPARDLLPMEAYFKAGRLHGISRPGKRTASMITSRGCPAHCVFCTICNIWGRKFRDHSAERVLSELKFLKDVYHVDSVQFEDDNLTLDQKRAIEIFIRMRPLNLKWNAPNGLSIWAMNEELIDVMKASGCKELKIAVESGDQEVLDNIIKKPVKLDEARRLIKHCHEIGLEVGSFFVVGLPGETKEQMQKTFDFAIENDLIYADYSVATPHFGTELFKIAEAKGYLDKNFSEADLFARKASITTPEFTAEWLAGKVNKEILRFNLHLLKRHPLKFFKIVVLGYFASDPFFIFRFFILKLKRLIKS